MNVKAGWDSSSWPCFQPKHAQQRDGHNCGVYVCLVNVLHTQQFLNIKNLLNVTV